MNRLDFLRRDDWQRLDPMPPQRVDPEQKRRAGRAGGSTRAQQMKRAAGRLDQAAIDTFELLPAPPPPSVPNFAAMLDARFVALKDWHKRIQQHAGCTRAEAERAAYRVSRTVEPGAFKRRAHYVRRNPK